MKVERAGSSTIPFLSQRVEMGWAVLLGGVIPGGEHTASLKQTAGPVNTSSDLTFLPSLLQLRDGTGQTQQGRRQEPGRCVPLSGQEISPIYISFGNNFGIFISFTMCLTIICLSFHWVVCLPPVR